MEFTAEELTGLSSPFDDLLGTRFVEASGDRVVAKLRIDPARHAQVWNIVHGGVYASVIETITSTGGHLWLDGEGEVVGVSNQTDFLRAVEDGELTFEATPLQRGRTTQLWQARVTDEQGRLVAHGKVRLLNRRG